MADLALSVQVPGFVARTVHISTDENEKTTTSTSNNSHNIAVAKGNADLSFDDLPRV